MKSFFHSLRIVSVYAAGLLLALSVEGCSSDKEDSQTDLYIQINQDKFELDADGRNEQILEITTNADRWSPTDPAKWLVLRQSENSIAITANPNPDQNSRTGTFWIVAEKEGCKQEKIPVTVIQRASGTTPNPDFVHFEDEAFKALMVGACDYDGDGEISLEEAARVKELSIDTQDLTSLVGIRSFVNLTSLECEYNYLTSLDVSGLDKLKYLICDHNNLTELRFEGCGALQSIICSYNEGGITTFDVRGVCPNLEFLDCAGNRLTTLDVHGMEKLKYVACEENRLQSLQVAGCPELHTLSFYQNDLAELDLTGLPKIDWIKCSNNQLEELDLTAQPLLRWLDCHDNYLSTLDLSSNRLMETLDCRNNGLTVMKIGNCDKLTVIDCSENRLTTLDLSNSPDVKTINCRANVFDELVLTGCTKVTTLICDNAELTGIETGEMAMLQEFVCNDNLLTSLDVSGNKALGKLYCQGNRLAVLWMAEGQTVADMKIDDRSVIQYK